jgi:nitrate reductase NapD
MPEELHVSSLVIHGRPERLHAVRSALENMDGVEIHAVGPTGKLIATLETESEYEILARMTAISLLEGVLSAALVFHHVEQLQQPG